MNPVYILIPVACALIGWFTNFVAVRMIFRPRRPVSILGLKIQGLMPRRQSDLARKIGETIESRLLTPQDIQSALLKPAVLEEAERLISEQVDVFFREKLGSNPMLSMFLQGDTALKIKSSLVEQLKTSMPAFIESFGELIEDGLDLKSTVEKKIEGFDLSTLESIVYDIARRELKLIEVVGGVLGLLVGLGQVAILWLARG